jgi:hypothetical protein
MFDWLFGRKRIRALEGKLADANGMLAKLDERWKASLKEIQQQRLLITALRDVNATLDTRCNEMEKRQ